MQPFLVVHCNVLDARLHRVLLGAPPHGRRGADAPPTDLLQQAERGILFLEDLATLEAPDQSRLTELIRAGWIRGGGRAARAADVRLIASLSGPTADALAAGRLQRELHEELAAIELHIPPLRERPEEIPILADRFLKLHSAAGREAVVFTPQAIELLQTLPWRGNVAELEALVRRALVFSDQGRIDAAEIAEQVRALEKHAQNDAPTACGVLRRPYGQPKSLAEQEREAIRSALAHARGNQSAAARILGVHRNTLLRRMKRLGITGEWAAAQRPRPRHRRRRETP
jgi:DNA-binding NtrC family response regulator